MLSETFSGTAITPGYDANGNLTDDGTYKYTYDAWNRLVQVTAKQDTDITLQTAKYDGLGRRVEKVVANSGDHDATWRYYYRGHQIIQANDGSGNLLMQVYHGTQYVDEVVAMRLPHGRAYVHQDANWNVTSLTDLTGAVLERYYYSPYGQVKVVAETYFGDYDGDGFVDSGDADDLCSNGEGCACEFTASVSGDCRVFDFDSDGDLDVADESTLSALYSGLSEDMQNRRIPSTTFSPAGNVFGHQGLVLDVEIGSNQNRPRQYSPKLKRFMQRDLLGITPGLPGIDEDGSSRLVSRPWVSPSMQYTTGSNVYEYLMGHPLSLTDPNGLCPMQWSGVDIFRTPLCPFSIWGWSNLGHTWMEIWGPPDEILEYPPGWITGPASCQTRPLYWEWVKELWICISVYRPTYHACLRDEMSNFTDHCWAIAPSWYEPRWKGWEPLWGCDCRKAVEQAVEKCGGEQRTVHTGGQEAKNRFCCSDCGKDPRVPR